MNSKLLFLLVLSSAPTFANSLLPPWVLLQRELTVAMNADPCVQVSKLSADEQYKVIKIQVCDAKKAQALASFINEKYDYGNISVLVTVYDNNGTQYFAKNLIDADDAANLLTVALTGNSYFVRAGTNPTRNPGAAFAEFKPTVIQYKADNIHDWNLNNNEVAAKVFEKILKLDPFEIHDVRLYATTSIINP